MNLYYSFAVNFESACDRKTPVEFRVSLDFLDILPGVMSLLKSCMGAAFTTASRCFVLLSLTCCLVSETEAAPRLLAQAPAAPDAGRNWTTALPPTDRFDWLQTTSGEWLKGELKALYSGSLEFDSKKFKLRTLKMEDVARYLGHGIKRISIETPSGNRTVDGVVTIDRQRVIVVSREDMPIARRVGRYLERQGLLERDAENSYLTTDAVSEDPMNQLLGHSMM